MPFFSKVFGRSDGGAKSKKNAKAVTNGHVAPAKPQWTDAWIRTSIHPEEVSELIRGCTTELKSRALDMPFLLLPFRPTSDPSAARTFIRNYFNPPSASIWRGGTLMQELRLSEPMVLASVIKWCWSRLPGGIVTWDSYELFRIGEHDSQYARDAFSTFIPISVDSDARTQIIFDFFDLLAAIAAHGKTNGLGGRKLSRYAGWWAFEHADTGKGFESGYRSWASAADATSHLFFAYLRSLSPETGKATNAIIQLPLSLQALLQSTEYPPEPPTLLFNETTRVVMIVDTVSPTPFALLRRAKNFEYRADDRALQDFSHYEDPVQALTDECRRVLRAISSSNQSTISTSKQSTGLRDASWSRFEDIGFGATIEESDGENEGDLNTMTNRKRTNGLSRTANSKATDLGRPTTPSWADFLSTGFVDENGSRGPSSLLLPPDKILPPININPTTGNQRGYSSQSHRRGQEPDAHLEPGELASINKLDMEDSFWWVWISSLSGEEPTARKAVFGRCALIETVIPWGRWLIMEEQVKGAAGEPAPGAYIAEKKGFFSFGRKAKLNRRKSGVRKSPLSQDPYQLQSATAPVSKTTIGPDQHARIQAAAAALQERDKLSELPTEGDRRGRMHEITPTRTNSVFTLQPIIMNEASPAMKWASQYDKATIRAKYLGDNLAGRGGETEMLTLPPNGIPNNASAVSLQSERRDQELPPPPLPPPVEAWSPSPRRDQSPVPPPPAPPVMAAEEMEPSNDEARQAADVPLPLDTPAMEKEAKQAAEIPLPVETPAMEKAPETPVNAPPVVQAPLEPVASPKSPKSSPEQKDHNKLKKRNKAGLKGMFGKRVPDKQAKSPTSPESSAAIAAARAALEGRSSSQPSGNLAPPPQKSGHFAGLRSRPAHRAAQAAPIVRKPIPQSPPKEPPIPVEEPTTTPDEFEVGRPRIDRDEEYDQLSRVDTDEREHADREFSKFDQGPLPEQYAFMPSDSPEESPARSQSPVEEHQMPSHYAAATMSEPLEEEDEEEAAQEIAHENPPQNEISPMVAQDRWAQIRKNAAERAAMQSEEQGRPSIAERTTDDGETSGEETIESRVARIKARVAELTGNMEQGRK